jgi:hypothetical protein
MVRTATGECVPSSDCFYRRNEYSRIWQAFWQVERILEINALPTVTKEVVEAARENLVIGQA